MKLLLVVILLTTYLCEIFAGEDDVVILTDDNFSTMVGETSTTLVMFYAPWCGHCKRLKPEYAKAAELVRDDDPPIAFAKIDCTEAGKETCNKHSVSGYPTLKIFKNGEMSQEYSGPREAAGMVKYMRAQVGPASRELLDKDALSKFLQVPESSIIGFFDKESDLKAIFISYADSMREKIRFAHTSNPDIIKAEGHNNAIVLYRSHLMNNKFEPNTLKFEGETKSDLSKFVKTNFHGLVGLRSREIVQEFENPLVVAYYAVDYVKNPKGTNYWRNRILSVAKKFVDKMNFAISPKDDFQHEINEYGYDYVSEKPLILARNKLNQKFIMKEPFSVDNLELFAQNLVDGNLEPYIKSEPVPENNNGPVKIAVANNFAEVVTDNGKDTLIEFYAPWCGHCKKLEPVLVKVAEQLKDENSVAIVKMDATANDVPPEFDVRGFPTLYWLPNNAKDKPVKYEGGREENDFIKYIAKQATNELVGFDRSAKTKKVEL